jgi:hypothetical protein
MFPAKKSGLLQPNNIPTKLWEIITMDLLMDLPKSEGYNSILVVVDHFSKMTCLIQTNKTLDAVGLVRPCWEQVWKDFSLPCVIISNRGPQFASNFIRAHYDLHSVETSLPTTYHPQSDGQSERMIQEVQKTLRMYVNHFQNDWASKTHTVEFTINNQVKLATGYTPFYLILRQHPNPGHLQCDLSKISPTVEVFVKGLQKEREIA